MHNEKGENKKRKCNEEWSRSEKKRKMEQFLNELEEPGEGLKYTWQHGNLFQLKIIMLFLSRAMSNNCSQFRLATEMSDAEKFDDVVLQYKSDCNEKWKFRLLQGKHRKYVYKDKITETELLSGNNEDDFSLQKYFHSFMKIKQRIQEGSIYSVFADNEIEDVIICTNAYFNSERLKNYFNKEDIDADKILKVDKDINKQWKEASIYRLHRGEDIQKNELFKKLKQILEKTSPFNCLVDILMDSLIKKKTLRNIGLVNEYCYALTKIFIVITRQIGKELEYYLIFKLNPELDSEESQNFREALCKKLLNKKSIDEQDIQNLREYKIKISADFAKVLEITKNVPEIKEVDGFVQELKHFLDIGSKNEQRNVYINISNCSLEFQANIIRLAGYVLIKKFGKIRFSTSFIKSEDIAFLPSNLKAFRDKLKKNLGAKIFESIYEYKFIINSNEKKKFETCEEGALSRKLPTLHQDKDIVEFFDKLKLVLNYPNQEEINELLESVLKEKLQILETRAFNSMYQEELLDWMGNSVGTFYTLDKANKLFSEIEKNLNLCTMNVFTKSYFANTFKKYKFKCDLLTKFLQDDDKQVLHLVFDDVKLGRMIIVQNFEDKMKDDQENLKIYTHGFGQMFLYSEQLLDSNFCSLLLKWFKDSKFGNFISIESDNTLKVGEYDETLFLSLKSLIEGNKAKKVFLITQNSDHLAEKFADARGYAKTVPILSYHDLLNISQEKLNKKKIMFQGEAISIGTLFDENSQHLIDQKVLSNIFDDNKIEIGTKRPELSDLESFHYVTNEEITKYQLSNALNDNPSDLFVICGTTKYEFLQLIDISSINRKDKIREFGRNSARADDIFIICNDEVQGSNLEEFMHICSEYRSFKKENERFSAHLLELKHSQLYWKRSYDASFYVPRKLYHVVIKEESLKGIVNEVSIGTNDKKNIFAISNIEINKFKEQFGIEISNESIINKEIHKQVCLSRMSSDSNPSLKNHVIILNKYEKSLSVLLRNETWLKHFNIHWLQIKNDDGNINRLIWRSSEGDIKLINQLQDKQIKFPISDHVLSEIVDNDKVIIIADEPGMGKSTALTYLLSKPKNCKEWIIKFNLINFKGKLKDLKDQNILDNFIEVFLSEIDLGTDENLAKRLLRHRIEEHGMITLLFDGFDEILDSNQNIVIKFLKYLKTTKAKIIVTTRLNVKDKLENALSVLSHPFQPFSKKNQKHFLQKFWKASLKLTFCNDVIKETLSKHVNTLFEPFYKNIKDDKYKFMSTPLITRMFAEAYQKTIEMFYKFGVTGGFKISNEIKNLTTLDLFEKFIQEKYDIYFKEKKTFENSSIYLKKILIKTLNKDHQRFAFHKLFLKHELTDILVEKDKLLPQGSLKEFKLVGLCQSISSKDNPDFIHLTFAEYFAACLLVDMLKRKENYSKYKVAHFFLLSQVFRENNKVVRMFLEQKIKKEKDIELNKKWNDIKNCDLLGEKVSTTCGFLDIKREEVTNDKQFNLRDLAFKFKAATINMGTYKGKRGHCLDFEIMDEDKIIDLFSCFLKEKKDIGILKWTLSYLSIIETNGGFHYFKAQHIILKNIYSLLRHYIVAAQEQNTIENDFVVKVLEAYDYPYIENFKTILEIVKKLTYFETYSEDEKKMCAEELVVIIFPSAPSYEEWSILILYLHVIGTTTFIGSFKSYINATKGIQKIYKDKILDFLDNVTGVQRNTEIVKYVQSFFIDITHHPNIIEDTKLSLNKLYDKNKRYCWLVDTTSSSSYKEKNDGCEWLEKKGIFIAMLLEIFTSEISMIYNGAFYNSISIKSLETSFAMFNGLSRADLLSSIFEYFIHPIIDRITIKNEKLSHINRIALLKMIGYFTYYGIEGKELLPFNSLQLKMTLKFFEEELQKHHHSPLEVVSDTVNYLFVLGKAGLKLINSGQKLIVLHSKSEFQYEFGCIYLDQIIKQLNERMKTQNSQKLSF